MQKRTNDTPITSSSPEPEPDSTAADASSITAQTRRHTKDELKQLILSVLKSLLDDSKAQNETPATTSQHSRRIQ